MTKILCIPKESYLSLQDKRDPIELIDIIQDNIQWIERDQAENDENFLQIIPYIAIIRLSSDSTIEIFTYRRLSKGNEKRLHDKFSIGVGGHIDFIGDEDNYPVGEVIERACTMELTEELYFFPKERMTIDYLLNNLYIVDCIYDPSNAVGRVHLGIAGYLTLTEDENVLVRETEKLEGKFLPLNEVKKRTDLETWSAIFLPNL